MVKKTSTKTKVSTTKPRVAASSTSRSATARKATATTKKSTAKRPAAKKAAVKRTRSTQPKVDKVDYYPNRVALLTATAAVLILLALGFITAL